MARSLEKRLKSDLNAIRYCLRTSNFLLMRPGRTPGGAASKRPSSPSGCTSGVPAPFVFATRRGTKQQRYNERGKNANRRKPSGCWEKPETLWLSCPSSGGVLSSKFANNALQHARAFVYNFFASNGFGGRGGGLKRPGGGRSGVLGGFGGVADAVLAGGLGLVHGGVGAGDELLGRSEEHNV